jgi:hypothetical protein
MAWPLRDDVVMWHAVTAVLSSRGWFRFGRSVAVKGDGTTSCARDLAPSLSSRCGAAHQDE